MIHAFLLSLALSAPAPLLSADVLDAKARADAAIAAADAAVEHHAAMEAVLPEGVEVPVGEVIVTPAVETPAGTVPEHLAWIVAALAVLRAVFAFLRRASFWVALPSWVRLVVLGVVGALIAFGDSYSTGGSLLASLMVALAAIAGGSTNGDVLANKKVGA